MKRTDIKVGAEYAHGRDYEYENGTADRVRVTGFTPVKQGWSYSARTVTGVAIEYLDAKGEVATYEGNDGEQHPRVGAVATRRIREEWATYAERWAEIRRERRAARRDAEIAADGRARFLADLLPALRAAGVEDEVAWIYTNQSTNLLELHVPEIFLLNEEGGRTSQIKAPLARSIDDFIKGNKGFEVKADVLYRLVTHD